MRILVIILVALLLAVGAGAALFYMNIYQPLDEKVKTSMPEFEKVKSELGKYKQREKMESAWIAPLAAAFTRELGDEIKSGSAEVLPLGQTLVVTIAEPLLYMPGSKTFSKESSRILQKLDSLLRNDSAKGKEVLISNMTGTAPAQTVGKKKVPGKDPRTLAAERSVELIKYFERNGMSTDAIIAGAYGQHVAVVPGAKINTPKTVIVISAPPTPAAPATQSRPATTVTSTQTGTAPATRPTVSPEISRPTTTAKPTSVQSSTTATHQPTPAQPQPQSRPAQR